MGFCPRRAMRATAICSFDQLGATVDMVLKLLGSDLGSAITLQGASV